MIPTLIAGRVLLTEQQKKELTDLGFDLVFHPDERIPVSEPERFEAVICNGLFQNQSLDEFSNLRVIQLSSAGLDRVPVSVIRERGIALFNAEDTYSIPMAEFAVGGILQLYKNSETFCNNKKEHRWEKDRNLRELAGKKVIVLGTGNVGTAVASRLSAFGCFVIGLSQSGKEATEFECVRTIEELDQEIPNADILVLAIPLTEKTEKIIDVRRLQMLKDDAVIVNVARGKLIEEEALIRWISNHPDGGAVLDVFREEPLSDNSPFWGLPNVILTPHNSFVGEGNSERLYQVIKKNLIEYRRTQE